MITCNACICILAFQMLKQMTVRHFHRSQIQGLQVQPGQPAEFFIVDICGCRVAAKQDGGPNLCSNSQKYITVYAACLGGFRTHLGIIRGFLIKYVCIHIDWYNWDSTNAATHTHLCIYTSIISNVILYIYMYLLDVQRMLTKYGASMFLSFDYCSSIL